MFLQRAQFSYIVTVLESSKSWRKLFTPSFSDISLVFIFCSTLISGMFSLSQSARPRSLDHSQEGHSLTSRIKCPCHVYPEHRFMLRMSEERRRRVYVPWTPHHSSSRVLGNKGFLRRLVRGWPSLMAIPILHSSRQWAISKKPAISLPLTPSIYFNTQQDPWCGKIRFLGLFNICFWQLQCVLFSLQKAAGELSRHFIFFKTK